MKRSNASATPLTLQKSNADLVRNAKINLINTSSFSSYKEYRNLDRLQASEYLSSSLEETSIGRRSRFVFARGKMKVEDLRRAVDSALAEIFGVELVHCFRLAKQGRTPVDLSRMNAPEIVEV
ncbi:hypothetical protein KI387_007794 [Taxus chinensis]|uniref:Uncharacterized protein n=1 Tax=Taxus chinensis TaxID=29808 RepID=A0AA38GRG2_TAXCH|nr:hypothetical protein KI387_007794 [Taxus chinensis]